MKWLPFVLLCALASGCTSVNFATAPREGSGGTARGGTRVEKAAVKQESKEKAWAATYCYADPMDPERCGNVFRMTNGHILAITLIADSDRGRYAGDRISIMDLTTNNGCRYLPSESPRGDVITDERYLVTFERTPTDLLISVSGVSVSFNDLCRWRAQVETQDMNFGTSRFKLCLQGVDGSFLFFSEKAATAWLDPEAPREDYLPTYVVPTHRKLADGKWETLSRSAIGDTGYIMELQSDGLYHPVLAK
ncbi:MAG: hypothetical protein K8T20_01250 [Planctomycetes bacterium]|nr:hypothetical protein [Planctomycetota bacterium]